MLYILRESHPEECMKIRISGPRAPETPLGDVIANLARILGKKVWCEDPQGEPSVLTIEGGNIGDINKLNTLGFQSGGSMLTRTLQELNATPPEWWQTARRVMVSAEEARMLHSLGVSVYNCDDGALLKQDYVLDGKLFTWAGQITKEFPVPEKSIEH